MKKFIAGLLCTILCTTSVFAADPFIEISGFEGDMEVMYRDGIKETKAPAVVLFIDGTAVYDADAVIKNGTTLVPLRIISENFGAYVTWNAETKTVSINKDGLDVKCTIGANFITVNGEEKEISNPAEIINSLTYVPLRAISTAFGASVGYIPDIAEDTRFITVDSKVRTKVTEEDAVTIAKKRYFEDFMPSMKEPIMGILGIDTTGLTQDNFTDYFPNIGAFEGKVTDMGHYWYVEFFGNNSSSALVDKETGEVYPTHRFSLVNFAVSDIGDYSGWGWNYQ